MITYFFRFLRMIFCKPDVIIMSGNCGYIEQKYSYFLGKRRVVDYAYGHLQLQDDGLVLGCHSFNRWEALK